KPLGAKLEDLPPRLRGLPAINPVPAAANLPVGVVSDNSNTQFAILGVWASVKYGIPMERTLALMMKRFRVSQKADGGWIYHFDTSGQGAGAAAMTGVGLLGLAVGHG